MYEMELNAIYIGPSTEVLDHGRKYAIEKAVYKNGHVMVLVNVDGYPAMQRMRYSGAKAYERDWRERL